MAQSFLTFILLRDEKLGLTKVIAAGMVGTKLANL
jgi:hypothetical protein